MITQKTIDKYKGKQFNNIKVLDYAYNKTACHPYFKCLCINCNSIMYMRPDAIIGNKIGCAKCMGRWRSEHFKEMYKDLPPKDMRFRKAHLHCQAKERNRKWLLTDEQVFYLLSQQCYYCGTTNKIGIDRINNDLDYEFSNCVPCCGYCNRLKMHNSLEKFIHKIYDIYHYYINKSSTTIPKGSTLQVNGSGSGEHLSKENKKIEMKIWSDLHSDMQQLQKVA